MSRAEQEPREAPETIPISYLNAYVYCPRRFYYEFVQQDMLDNEYIIEGTLMHERVDEPGQHSINGEIQIQRLYLVSQSLHITGFADLVQEENGIFIPVEYKHGRKGRWMNDHIQLCAQALCLEESQPGQRIDHGYIFYGSSQKRLRIQFDNKLREQTRETITAAFDLAVQPQVPSPLEGKMAARCRDCSLRELCLPEEVNLLRKEGKKIDANTLSY